MSQLAMVNAQIIPEGDSVFFSNWAGSTELPSPDEVREHDDVPDCHAAVIVRFVHLDLVVKYGPHVRATEGQALWVIKHFTDVQAPTVYGWCTSVFPQFSCGCLYRLVQACTSSKS